jgi:hypothetical protein
MTVVRGTANIKDTLSVLRVTARFRTLTRRCHVLALQEWPGNRNRLLAGAGQLVLWPRRPGARKFKPRGAWTFHRSRLGGGPIGVRNDQGEIPLSCKTKILSGPGYVGRMPGKRSVLGPTRATRLKARMPDGSTKVRYCIHLVAGVQNGKAGYRRDAAAVLRVARHKREHAKLERLVARDQRRGHDVEVYGDPNFHHMPIKGLHSWWALDPDAGTFGSRAIDGVWTTLPPDDVAFLPPLVRGEHRSVITTSNRQGDQ